MYKSIRSLSCTVAALAGLLLSLPAGAAPTPTPGPQSVTRTMQLPGQAHPYLVAGLLSAPSTAAPAEIARAYLATRPPVLASADPSSLEVGRTVPIKGGHLVRFEQRHNGLPVIGSEARVRVDDRGRVRWVYNTARAIPASVDAPASVSPVQALAAVAQAAGYGDAAAASFDVARTVRPAIYALAMKVPRRAYWVELPRDLRRMQTVRAYVDAHTGHLYQLDNMTRFDDGGVPEDGGSGEVLPACGVGTHMGYVYETNPAEYELSCVSLGDYLAPEATILDSADITIGNCIDRNTCVGHEVQGETVYVHTCEMDPIATTNADGNFTDHLEPGHSHPSDAFAEVQAFYHLNKVYAVARSLGDFADLESKPIQAMVNYQQASWNPEDSGCEGETYVGSDPLLRYDNAFFSSGGMFGGEGDLIAFGQGVEIDWSYDGDVAYHEFGHAVMYTISPGLSGGFNDVFGRNSTPGGLHEGYADLMTLFTTNDTVVGEYVANDEVNGIRNMDNDKSCPKDLVGESHYDAEPFTGAVLEARALVASGEAERRAFDEALYAAQHALGRSDDFRTTAAKIVSEIELAFDADTANLVAEVFAQRGIDGCNNRIMDVSPTQGKKLMFVPGSRREDSGDHPAPVQFRYVLEEPATALRIMVQYSYPSSGTATESFLRVALKRDGNAIHWTFPDGVGAGFFEESTELALSAPEAGGGGSAVFQDTFAPGVYHMQIYNQGRPWVLQNISIYHSAAPGAPDAGPVPEVDAGEQSADPTTDDGGCGCTGARGTSAATGAAVGLLILVVGLTLWPRRRRRRR